MRQITSQINFIPKRKLGEDPGQVIYTINHLKELLAPSLSDRTLWANDANPVLTIEQDGTGPNLLLKHATVPELRFEEEDQTDPAGRYRERINADIWYFERAASANWGTTAELLKIDYTNGRLTLFNNAVNSSNLRLYNTNLGNASIDVVANDSALWLSGGPGNTVAASIGLYGKDTAGTPGRIYIRTTNASGVATERLNISGNLATAVATWANVTHTGFNSSGTLTISGSLLDHNPTALSGTPSTTGSWFDQASATFTDNNTLTSGTAAAMAFNTFQAPTLAATNLTVTTTDAATLYIAAAPVAGTNQTITNPYAIWVDGGICRFDSGLILGDYQSKPAAGASNRGWFIIERGGAGVADVLYCCMKSAAGAYSWVAVATG